MKSKSIALLLILLIGLSPVSTVFAWCGEMDDTATVRQLITDTGEGSITHTLQRLNGSFAPVQHAGMGCHSGDACLFHLCCGLGLTSSVRFSAFDRSNPPSRFIHQALSGTTSTPELRPPIQTL